jgi:hypothetical protein
MEYSDKEYYLKHKEQILKRQKDYYSRPEVKTKHLEYQREYRNRPEVKERRKKENKKYGQNLRTKKWIEQHSEKHKEYMRNYYQIHKEQYSNQLRQWRKANPELWKILHKKGKAKRRELGFIPLNEPFARSVAHHIDKSHIINIPEFIHISIRHNVFTGEGMQEINTKVFQWFNSVLSR